MSTTAGSTRTFARAPGSRALLKHGTV